MTTVIESELRNEVEAEMALDAVTIELCIAKGCTTHYVSDMIQCTDCGAYMCSQHVCDCPIEMEDAA